MKMTMIKTKIQKWTKTYLYKVQKCMFKLLIHPNFNNLKKVTLAMVMGFHLTTCKVASKPKQCHQL